MQSSSSQSLLEEWITKGNYIPFMPMSEFEFDAMLRKKIEAYKRDRDVNIHNKAKAFVDFTDEVVALQTSASMTEYAFITVNPKPEITFEDFSEKIEALVQKCFDWSMHVFEIRQAPDQGLHCHLIGRIKEKYYNSNFARTVKTPFVPKVCGNAKAIKIDYIPKKELVKVKSYLTKAKVAKSKKAANDATLAWRLDNDIPLCITSGDIPTCLSPDTQLINLN